MDEFLDYLIKKSDIHKEFSVKKTPMQKQNSTYKKITTPTVNSYVVFDFETTGMNFSSNRIIEIGAVKVIDNKITDIFNQLVNPEQHISDYIADIVHITNNMVMDCPTIVSILPEFLDFIGELPLVAHNARFDMGFLIANAQRLGYDVNNCVLDTLSLSRKYNKDCAKHNLNYLTKHFNIQLDNAHRAYYDALATCTLYKIIQERYENTISIM